LKGTRKREQLHPGVGDSALCTMSEFDPFDSLSVSRQVHNFMHVNLLPSDSHPGIAQQSYGESCSLFIGESRELPPGTTRFVSNPWGVSSFSPLVEMSSWVIMELEVRIPQAQPALLPYHKFFTAKSPYRFLALKTGASALSLDLFRYRI
jgi:hypothetical protein